MSGTRWKKGRRPWPEPGTRGPVAPAGSAPQRDPHQVTVDAVEASLRRAGFAEICHWVDSGVVCVKATRDGHSQRASVAVSTTQDVALLAAASILLRGGGEQ